MNTDNEELDKILKQHREWMRGIRTDHLIGTSHEEAKAQILKSFTPNHEVERLVNQGIQDFIKKQTIIEKFETLNEYTPMRHQIGYVEGLKEEVEDFIAELQGLLAPIDSKQAVKVREEK